jgi:hypothetical protein
MPRTGEKKGRNSGAKSDNRGVTGWIRQCRRIPRVPRLSDVRSGRIRCESGNIFVGREGEDHLGRPAAHQPPRAARLGRLLPPRLRVEPAGAQQHIAQSVLDSVVNQTLAAMNDGAPSHVDIVHRVKPPESASPRLKPVCDEAEFIARNVIRYYGGWWSGRPSELKPAPRAPLAREVAALAGGAAALLRRAQEFAAAGETRLAGYLADYAFEAAREDPEIRAGVAGLYDKRAADEASLMAENIFSPAAASVVSHAQVYN